MRVRKLDERGAAFGERVLLVNNNAGEYKSFTGLYGTLESNLAAIEILKIEGGYVFFRTGADVANPTNVLAAMDTLTESPLGTLIYPGELLGQAAPTRPLNAYQGAASILTRPINQLFDSNLAAGTNTYSQSNTSTLLVVPNRFQRLLLDLGIKSITDSATTVTVEIAFQLIAYDDGTEYADNRTSEISLYSQVISRSFSGTSTTPFRASFEFPLPNPGRYRVFLKLTTNQVLVGVAPPNPTQSFLQLFHEIWS